METVTFYSYKGGVGRTLALKNYAMFLAKYGFSVCMLDFDLEAPGLHYKFAKYLEQSAVSQKKGIVDLIYDFQHENFIPEQFDDYSLLPQVDNASGKTGKITLIPAGDSMSPNYWNKLSNVNWEQLLYEPESTGDLFFLELKERIRTKINPDFLLIDSRTGITEVGGLCTSLLPDKVVFLICNNEENKEGARLILRNLKNAKTPFGEFIDLTFVLSRFPTPKDPGNELESKDRETFFEHLLNYLNEPLPGEEELKIINQVNVINSDRALEISESVETNIELQYTNLFVSILPVAARKKIEKEAKNWYK
jgi:MinD-like ATPase involved in chromosome partitioning or flagellar assembly